MKVPVALLNYGAICFLLAISDDLVHARRTSASSWPPSISPAPKAADVAEKKAARKGPIDSSFTNTMTPPPLPAKKVQKSGIPTFSPAPISEGINVRVNQYYPINPTLSPAPIKSGDLIKVAKKGAISLEDPLAMNVSFPVEGLLLPVDPLAANESLPLGGPLGPMDPLATNESLPLGGPLGPMDPLAMNESFSVEGPVGLDPSAKNESLPMEIPLSPRLGPLDPLEANNTLPLEDHSELSLLGAENETIASELPPPKAAKVDTRTLSPAPIMAGKKENSQADGFLTLSPAPLKTAKGVKAAKVDFPTFSPAPSKASKDGLTFPPGPLKRVKDSPTLSPAPINSAYDKNVEKFASPTLSPAPLKAAKDDKISKAGTSGGAPTASPSPGKAGKVANETVALDDLLHSRSGADGTGEEQFPTDVPGTATAPTSSPVPKKAAKATKIPSRTLYPSLLKSQAYDPKTSQVGESSTISPAPTRAGKAAKAFKPDVAMNGTYLPTFSPAPSKRIMKGSHDWKSTIEDPLTSGVRSSMPV